MHSGRVMMLVVGVIWLGFLGTLFWLVLQHPNPFLIGFLVAVALVGLSLGWRVCYTPDAWYEWADERDRRWFRAHPYIMGGLVLLVAVSVLSDL